MAALADYDEVHRELWPDQRVVDESFEGAPLYGLIRKDPAMGEKVRHIALQYGRPQGRSRTFATAQSNADSSKYEEFQIKTVDDYGVGTLTGKLLRSSKIGGAMLVDAMDRETQSAFAQVRRSAHIGIFGNASGARGVIASGGITDGSGIATITLANAADIKNFEVGQSLVAAATELGSLRAATAYPIQSLNLAAGTLVVTGTAAATSSWAAGDTLFTEGDAANGASFTGLPGPMLAGLSAWIPTTAPTSTAFFGVDRSVDSVRLGGWRFTAAGLGATTIFETIMRGCSAMSRAGDMKAPDIAVLNGEDYGELLADIAATSAGNGESIKRKADKADVYYSGVRIHTPIGPVDVFHDPQCPQGRGYLLNLSSWTLGSIGQVPFFVEEDGLRILRSSSADSYEFRMAYHAQLYCNAPLWNAVLTWPT